MKTGRCIIHNNLHTHTGVTETSIAAYFSSYWKLHILLIISRTPTSCWKIPSLISLHVESRVFLLRSHFVSLWFRMNNWRRLAGSTLSGPQRGLDATASATPRRPRCVCETSRSAGGAHRNSSLTSGTRGVYTGCDKSVIRRRVAALPFGSEQPCCLLQQILGAKRRQREREREKNTTWRKEAWTKGRQKRNLLYTPHSDCSHTSPPFH